MPVARLSSVRLVFDRGTTLLRDLDPGVDASAIPGVLWDPRVQAFRTPAYRYRALHRELTRRAVPFLDEVRIPQLPLGSWSPIELRPYQEAALWAWELAERRAVVVLPTGSGKTRLALAAMARAGSSALCLVPTRILLAQWLHHIKRAYAGPVGCYGDGTHELAARTVATFESAYRHMDRLGNRFDLLVVDEAHHFGCGLRDEALEMSIAAARLGLTATPPRDAAVAARLVELVGPTAYELTIGDLAGTFLSSFDIVTLHLDLTAAERKAYEGWMTTFRQVHAQFRRVAPGASWEDFARTAARTVEGRRALDAFRRARKLVTFTEAKREMLGVLLHRHDTTTVPPRTNLTRMVLPARSDVPMSEFVDRVSVTNTARRRPKLTSPRYVACLTHLPSASSISTSPARRRVMRRRRRAAKQMWPVNPV